MRIGDEDTIHIQSRENLIPRTLLYSMSYLLVFFLLEVKWQAINMKLDAIRHQALQIYQGVTSYTLYCKVYKTVRLRKENLATRNRILNNVNISSRIFECPLFTPIS
jgi:hypothetical protein